MARKKKVEKKDEGRDIGGSVHFNRFVNVTFIDEGEIVYVTAPQGKFKIQKVD